VTYIWQFVANSVLTKPMAQLSDLVHYVKETPLGLGTTLFVVTSILLVVYKVSYRWDEILS
jgi:hypothetical protein